MDVKIEPEKQEWTPDRFIESLEKVNPGHRLPSGEINPDLIEDEIKNKLSGIGLFAYKLGERTPDALRKLISLYPTHKSFMKDTIEGFTLLKNHLSVFEEEFEK